MNIEKCISCKHYEPFFNGCYLYQKEIYLGEGDFDGEDYHNLLDIINKAKENKCI